MTPRKGPEMIRDGGEAPVPPNFVPGSHEDSEGKGRDKSALHGAPPRPDRDGGGGRDPPPPSPSSGTAPPAAESPGPDPRTRTEGFPPAPVARETLLAEVSFRASGAGGDSHYEAEAYEVEDVPLADAIPVGPWWKRNRVVVVLVSLLTVALVGTIGALLRRAAPALMPTVPSVVYSGYCSWGTDSDGARHSPTNGASARPACDGEARGGGYCNEGPRNCEMVCDGHWCLDEGVAEDEVWTAAAPTTLQVAHPPLAPLEMQESQFSADKTTSPLPCDEQADGVVRGFQSSAVQLQSAEAILGPWFSTENVAIYNNTVVVGAPYNNEKRGAAFVFVVDACGHWSQQAKLVAPGAEWEDFFGFSVGIDEDSIVVGAPHADHNRGAAHVYVFHELAWTHQAKLFPPDGDTYDLFGHSVGISGDAVVVGAHGDGAHSGDNNGSCYIFQRSVSVWSHQAKLSHPSSTSDNRFGFSVGIYSDTAVVSDVANRDLGGSVHVYGLHGLNWTHRAELLAPDGSVDDAFGCSVAIHGDTVVVGVSNDDFWVPEGQRGSAHVFAREGAVWRHEAKLLAPNGGGDFVFGYSVAVHGDILVVGATHYYDEPGSAHVYLREGGSWAHQALLLPPVNASSTNFGRSVGVYDGTVVVHPADDGETFVFLR